MSASVASTPTGYCYIKRSLFLSTPLSYVYIHTLYKLLSRLEPVISVFSGEDAHRVVTCVGGGLHDSQQLLDDVFGRGQSQRTIGTLVDNIQLVEL